VAAPPIEVPRAVRPGAAERSGIFFAVFADLPPSLSETTWRPSFSDSC